jgi:FixJ family two-component response regulator
MLQASPIWAERFAVPVSLWTRETGLPTISIVDDDESSLEAMKSLVKSLRFTVEAFSSALDFLASPHAHATDCLIADINMPRMTGVELHRHLVRSGNLIPTILVTAYPDDGIQASAMAEGVLCFLSKPVDASSLLACVRLALQRIEPGKDHS